MHVTLFSLVTGIFRPSGFKSTTCILPKLFVSALKVSSRTSLQMTVNTQLSMRLDMIKLQSTHTHTHTQRIISLVFQLKLKHKDYRENLRDVVFQHPYKTLVILWIDCFDVRIVNRHTKNVFVKAGQREFFYSSSLSPLPTHTHTHTLSLSLSKETVSFALLLVFGIIFSLLRLLSIDSSPFPHSQHYQQPFIENELLEEKPSGEICIKELSIPYGLSYNPSDEVEKVQMIGIDR